MALRRVISCRQPLPRHISPTSSAASSNPRLLPKVPLHKSPSSVSACKTPGHSTKVVVPFSHAPPDLTLALFIAVLSRFWRSCQNVFPWCAWRARESLDWTRGKTPTHTLSIPRLVWLSSLSLSGWVAKGSSHCSHSSTPPPSFSFSRFDQ